MTASARGGMPYIVSFVTAVFLGALPAKAGTYAFFDPDASGNRLWSYSSGWFTCGDYKNDQTKNRGNISALGGLPDSTKVLMVDSDKLTPATPLVIDAGRDVIVSQMNMSYYLGAPYGDEPHMVALEVGPGATLTTTSQANNFNVGYCVGGQAMLLVDEGATVSNILFKVGVSGYGVVTNRGGLVDSYNNNNNRGLFLGCNSTGTGVYSQVSGTLRARCGRIGVAGMGRMEILGGCMNGLTYIGTDSGGRGTVLLDGVVVTNETTVGCAANAWGCLHLRGATNYADTVKIRDHVDAYGQLRGWGSIFKYSATAVCGEMGNFFMNGQAIADGEGVDGRILDLRLIRTGDGGQYSNVKVTIPNGATGTNGWYAVNKGILAYPMISVRSAGWSGTFGANTNEFCDAVNTVRIDYNQSVNKSPWIEALLYANDSALVPSGLKGRTLGVWGFRSNIKYDNRDSQLSNLTNFSLRFRYDHSTLASGASVSVMRYDQSAGEWHRIAKSEHDSDSPFISVTAQTADGAGYDRNLGIFAVVNDSVGLSIFVR